MATRRCIKKEHSVLPKTCSIVVIYHRGARKHTPHFIWVQCVVQLPPVKEIIAHCMPPPHRAPGRSFNVVLEEQMPETVVVDEPVRVVNPVLLRRKVELWSVQFRVGTQGPGLLLFTAQ